MKFQREFLDLLLAKIDLVELINGLMPLQKKSSDNYFARCPFHQEKSPSFSVSQRKQFFYCFGCGAHGNAIDFVMQFERLSYVEAVENLARDIGLSLPEPAQDSVSKNQSLEPIYEILARSADFYYQGLCRSECAI